MSLRERLRTLIPTREHSDHQFSTFGHLYYAAYRR